MLRPQHAHRAINHEPAITYIQTGNQVTGRPCLGSWVSYGLGSLNQNLPAFVALVARPSNTEQVQAIAARLWSSGCLPGEHAGVAFRSSGDPILYINNPPGVQNFNNLPYTLSTARYLTADTFQSSFIFVCGGTVQGMNATGSCETSQF